MTKAMVTDRATGLKPVKPKDGYPVEQVLCTQSSWPGRPYPLSGSLNPSRRSGLLSVQATVGLGRNEKKGFCLQLE